MGFEDEADGYFEGPVDKYGQPKISNDPLDIEVRFQKEGPVLYRWVWDSETKGAYVGPWRESRKQAWDEGERWLQSGRL
jgi:hypothetical protein